MVGLMDADEMGLGKHEPTFQKCFDVCSTTYSHSFTHSLTPSHTHSPDVSGKTVQTAAFLQMLKEHQNLRGPFLVVAPLSTVVNWQREVTAWTDMDVVLYHGSQEEREIIRRLEFSYATQQQEKGAKKSTRQSDGVKLEVVVVSPETCLAMDSKSSSGRVRRALSKIYWDVIVVDEAHKLKNHESKFTTTLREEYSYRNSLLLTGTPLQNNTEELWTLLNFVDRAAFADRDAFMEEFGALKTAAQLEALHGRLKPYLLRREKDNVEKTVPPKEEVKLIRLCARDGCTHSHVYVL